MPVPRLASLFQVQASGLALRSGAPFTRNLPRSGSGPSEGDVRCIARAVLRVQEMDCEESGPVLKISGSSLSAPRRASGEERPGNGAPWAAFTTLAMHSLSESRTSGKVTGECSRCVRRLPVLAAGLSLFYAEESYNARAVWIRPRNAFCERPYRQSSTGARS
jgi:hypothetical protein